MNPIAETPKWMPGSAPIAVVMISLNEGHNLRETLENLKGFAQEVILVDSFSVDDTIDIALEYGVQVVQRKFTGFGDQWNFALRELPITAPWTMKLDPDERLDETLKHALCNLTSGGKADGIVVKRKLFFMQKALPIIQPILRVWRSGTCRFTDVAVNEHPVVEGRIVHADGELAHHDSPDLAHWFTKQNKYTTMEAVWQYQRNPLAAEPKLFGSVLERRMWLKRHFWKVPGRYLILFLYNYLVLGAWRAGRAGYIWARLRSDIYRIWEYKLAEIRMTGRLPKDVPSQAGHPDPRVRQYQ